MNQLPPDPDSLEKWQKLPQNTPSKQAHSPMTAGGKGLLGLVIILAGLMLLSLLLQRGLG
jgi:hypothetical protein